MNAEKWDGLFRGDDFYSHLRSVADEDEYTSRVGRISLLSGLYFQGIDGLITNFHLPNLIDHVVAALVGRAEVLSPFKRL